MRALRTRAVDVLAFRIPGRPGHFVLTEDFVDWLIAMRARAQVERIESAASTSGEPP